MQVSPHFRGVYVNLQTRAEKPRESDDLLNAAKEPANAAMIALLEGLNQERGGTHVEFYHHEDPPSEIFAPPSAGDIRAQVVVGRGEGKKVLKSGIGPESRKKGSILSFSRPATAHEYLVQVLAHAFRLGQYEQAEARKPSTPPKQGPRFW